MILAVKSEIQIHRINKFKVVLWTSKCVVGIWAWEEAEKHDGQDRILQYYGITKTCNV
jgi:hypothetical protein